MVDGGLVEEAERERHGRPKMAAVRHWPAVGLPWEVACPDAAGLGAVGRAHHRVTTASRAWFHLLLVFFRRGGSWRRAPQGRSA